MPPDGRLPESQTVGLRYKACGVDPTVIRRTWLHVVAVLNFRPTSAETASRRMDALLSVLQRPALIETWRVTVAANKVDGKPWILLGWEWRGELWH